MNQINQEVLEAFDALNSAIDNNPGTVFEKAKTVIIALTKHHGSHLANQQAQWIAFGEGFTDTQSEELTRIANGDLPEEANNIAIAGEV